MKVKIQTLTPLWTGGIDGSCDRIHETGIIGSMRWWYEAIVRGLGGSACDPSQHECIFDGEKYRKSTATDERQRLKYAGLCDVCQVFGATGWRRRFRIEVVEDKTKPIWNAPPNTLNIRPPDRSRGWYLPPGKMGNVTFCLTGEEKTLDLLASLFLFLEKWGNVGAKPQSGYGVFKLIDSDEIKIRASSQKWSVLGTFRPSLKNPDLRRIGFFRYNFYPKNLDWWEQVPGIKRVAIQVYPIVTTYKTVPLTPSLKNIWRFSRWHGGKGDEMWMFGTKKWRDGEETALVRSKVAVSWAYPQNDGWEARGWGWLQKPRIADNLWDVLNNTDSWDEIVRVSGSLKAYPTGAWREWSKKNLALFLEATK